MSHSSHIISQDAALIATFYGSRGELDLLWQRLLDAFGPFTEPQAGFWWNDARNSSLRLFEPVEARDTSVIQLTLGLPDDVNAQNGWAGMRWELSNVLQEDTYWSEVWGYTLIFQARVAAESWPLVERQDEVALDRLLATVRRLQVTAQQPPVRLAHSKVAGGWLFLLRVPLEQDEFDPAMIYVALAPSEETERELVQKVLLGSDAMLFMPDLIAHKGYHQRREYRQGDIKERYETAAETLFKETTGLLAQRESKKAHNLARLTQKYEQFLAAVPRLESLRISLERQLYNFELLRTQSRLGDILTFHHSTLRVTRQELNLLVAKGKETLDVTKTTIDLVQARLDEAKETRQQQIEILLAVIGSAFAITQILDRHLTAALYTYLTAMPICPQQDILFLGAMQVAITLAITLAFGVMVWRWRG